jgi:hypothetical protein
MVRASRRVLRTLLSMRKIENGMIEEGKKKIASA